MHWVCVDKSHLPFSTHERSDFHHSQLNLCQKISPAANIGPLKVVFFCPYYVNHLFLHTF